MGVNFIRAVVVLPVNDVKEARQWYARALEFKTVYLHNDPTDDPEGNYAILNCEGVEVHLILDESPREHPWITAGTGYLFLIVNDIEVIYQAVSDSGVKITRGIEKEDWGARAFKLTDPSGNLIMIAEQSDS